MFFANKTDLIHTPSGFESFAGIQVVKKRGQITVLTCSGHEIKCSPNHRLMTSQGWKLAIDLTLEDVLVGKGFESRIFFVDFLDGEFDYYDVVGVQTSQFYANDLLSHNCEFLGSSNTLIDGAVLRRLVAGVPTKHTGDIRIFHEPYKFDPDAAEEGQPTVDGLYIIVVDTSRGVGGDYSAFIVFDVSTIPYKVAAVYHNNFVSPLLYPNFIYQAAKYYNDALVLVETNDIGGQVADALSHDLEYEHMLYTNKSGLNSTTTITPGFGQGSITGVRTTKTVKRIGCSNFKTLVESDKIMLNDERLIEELFRFVQKGQSYEAEEGHDDLVMCCVLFSWLTNQPYFKEITNGDIRQNLYIQNAKAIEESLTPFGLMHDGRDTMETAPVLNLDEEHMSFEQWMAC